MRAYDVVLLCTDVMSHSVLDMIDEEMKKEGKYQFVNNHNEDIIAHRAQFAGIQLGII